jgi:hypothetical protein
MKPRITILTIGHNVRSREAVDGVMRHAADAGATIVMPGRETF